MPECDNRLVVHPDFTEEEVHEVAWDLNWDLTHYQNKEGDNSIDAWVSKRKGVEIHLVSDGLVGLRYFTLYGEKGDEVARKIIDSCQLWEPGEALEHIRSAANRGEKLRAVYASVLGSVEQRDDVVNVLQEVAADPDPGIRQSVVIAAAYSQWPKLLDMVHDMSERDSADSVRRNAQILLEGLRSGEGES